MFLSDGFKCKIIQCEKTTIRNELKFDVYLIINDKSSLKKTIQ